MAGIRTELPFPTQPWEDAKNKFLEGLSDEEIKRFKNATLENLFYDASASQKKYARGSRVWAMQERITSLVDGVDEYAKALDVYSNAYSLILCPIWGSIRVVLHIARESGKLQERLVDMFSSIGDALPRFRIYESIFRSHERLLRAISTAYLDILNFCINAKQFFSQNKSTPIPMSIVCKAMWKPFRQSFDNYIIEFRKHQKRVEKEAGLAYMIESARGRQISKDYLALQKRNDRIGKRHRLLASLQTVDYQAKHRTLSGFRHPGTNTWLQTYSMFRSWIDSQSSDCLCCYGIPGSGKSVLASSAVNDLVQSINDPAVIVCYYYFDYADAKSLDLIYLFGSLMKQVVIHMPLDVFDDSFDSPIEDWTSAPLEDQKSIIIQLLQNFTKVIIILDGLDELTRDGQAVALELVDHLLQLSTPTLKLLITSRIEEQLIRRRLQPYNCFELSTAQIQNDILLYVEETLEAAASENPRLKNLKLRQDVRNALVKGANGMFLWVKFQMYDIREALTEDAIRTTLQNLPKDLSETYARIVKKVNESEGGRQKIEMMSRILRWVSCARRPLRINELEEAVGLQKTDTYLHTDRVATSGGEKMIAACGNLVVYNRTDHTVTLAHHTIQLFLCGQRLHDVLYPDTIHFSIVEADSEIGEICVAYLSFSDFETQLVKAQPPVVIETQEVERIIWGNVPLSALARRVMSWFGPGEKRSHIDFALPISEKATPALKAKYLILEYIIEFWTSHVAYFSQERTACWKSFKNVALFRQLQFEFRPWNNEFLRRKFDGEPPEMRIYSWAVDHGIRSFLELMKQELDAASGPLNYWPARLRGVTEHGYWSNSNATLYNQGRDFLIIVQGMPRPSSLINTFWQGELIHRAASKPSDQPLFPMFLQFVLKELELHSRTDPNSRRSAILEEAILLALHARNTDAFLGILTCVRGYRQFSHILISMVRQGFTEQSLILPVLERLDQGSDQIVDPEADLIFALDRILQTFVVSSSFGLSQHPYGWLFVAMALSYQSKYLGAVQQWAKNMYDFTRKVAGHTFIMPRVNWICTELGTEEASIRLNSISGLNPISILFRNAHMVNMGHTVGERVAYICLMRGTLSCVHYQPEFWNEVFSVERLERDGIHCLEWAIDWDMPRLVQDLLRHHKASMDREDNHAFAVKVLLHAAKKNQAYFEVLAKLEWPQPVVYLVRKDAAFKALPQEISNKLRPLLTSELG